MLKTIKKKKEVRIDELIDYITMNAHKLLDGKEFYTFKSKHGTDVTIDAKGNVNFSYMLYLNDDLYTVEVEEEIDEDTFFEQCVVVFENDFVFTTSSVHTIRSINEVHDNVKYIHGIVNGKLELVWEKQN